MNKLSYSNKMRWIAGGLYGLLAVYQMFLSKAILQQGTISGLPFTLLYNVALILVAAAMCVWMFHGREALSGGARRAVVAGTFFTIVFELLTYSDQTNAINITLYGMFPSLADNTVVLYALMVLRLLVLIFAAFMLVGTARDKAQNEEENDVNSSGYKPVILEDMEEIVLEEADEITAEKPEENTSENAGENKDENAEKLEDGE